MVDLASIAAWIVLGHKTVFLLDKEVELYVRNI
jgi:hypothetical protein